MTTLTDYHSQVYAHELARRHAPGDIRGITATLMGAKVDLNPHQVDAALFAFRSPLSQGAILADEVGLGKTIEAGIVLAQKWAERRRAIIIIAPASLRTQWQQELKDKFGLPSVILNRKQFDTRRDAGVANPFQADAIVIASYDFARRKADLLRLVDWDVAVLDEAHRLRNVFRKGPSIAKDLKHALARAPKLLLTATPLQNSLFELYGLVSFVDDHCFGDIRTFRAQYARLTENTISDLKSRIAPLCKRTLRRQVLEYIRYTERIALTQDFTLTPEEEALYSSVSSFLQREDLRCLPAGRRGMIVLVLRKLLASSSYAIAGALRTMLDRLHDLLATQAPAASDSLEALSEDFEAGRELQEEDTENGAGSNPAPLAPAEQEAIRREIEQLREMVERAEGIMDNAKGNALLHALREGFALATEHGGASKAIIFTESRRTQNYLFALLSANGYEGRIVIFNGVNSDKRATAIHAEWKARHAGTGCVTGSRDVDVRSALTEAFREQASIMIATEAASEGINLQFCSLVINYDLPWNPQRIEQRIGRCHRYGQKHDVVVVNFLNRANAADRRVFELLSEKFRLFSGVFGASDEVLGSIESGVDFERRIAEIYQTCRTPEEIQASFDELQQSLAEQIDENMMATRQKLLENFDAEVAEKLRVYRAEATESLGRFGILLWELTRHELAGKATFDNARLRFTTGEKPRPGAAVPWYALAANAHDEHYHSQHPLALHLIETARGRQLPPACLTFALTGSGKNISILDEFRGRQGVLAVHCITFGPTTPEDHLAYVACTNDGEPLDQEQARRLFDLPARLEGETEPDVTPLQPALADLRAALEANIAERNATFFEQEMEKLDRWAEERKQLLEMQITEMDKAIREAKGEARRVAGLEAKLALQRKAKVLEGKRNEMRRRMFTSQDEVDEQKDALLDTVEQRLRQGMHERELFRICWRLE